MEKVQMKTIAKTVEAMNLNVNKLLAANVVLITATVSLAYVLLTRL